jgi:hypothetical protein
MGVRPRDFWALSLPEWRALCDARLPAARAGLNRNTLDQLLLLHPDKTHG